MTFTCSFKILRAAAVLVISALCWTVATSVANGASRAQTVISRALPSMDGSHLKAIVVEVIYAPGEFSPPHSHPCPVIGVVLEGAVRTKTKGEPEVIYTTGESFYEPPNGTHEISANASLSKPAKFLAYFICDHETPLSVSPLKD